MGHCVAAAAVPLNASAAKAADTTVAAPASSIRRAVFCAMIVQFLGVSTNNVTDSLLFRISAVIFNELADGHP
ncbi:hypothetical protein GCM10023353_01880 [Tomitella cavernea]|uniref:Uncharacterized protein n=1 Tax=Tomitella cavernea TaxID=1387982 RepID=A0ABP9C5Q3_9ACTN